jgi:hypothetical protein
MIDGLMNWSPLSASSRQPLRHPYFINTIPKLHDLCNWQFCTNISSSLSPLYYTHAQNFSGYTTTNSLPFSMISNRTALKKESTSSWMTVDALTDYKGAQPQWHFLSPKKIQTFIFSITDGLRGTNRLTQRTSALTPHVNGFLLRFVNKK